MAHLRWPICYTGAFLNVSPKVYNMHDTNPPDTRAGQVHRLTIEHSVYYAVQEPAETYAAPAALVIAAHGYGQACKSFIRRFRPWCAHNVLVVAPQGPSQFYWKHDDTPRVGFSWMTSYMRENTIEELMAYMGRLLEVLAQRYTFDSSRVFTLGFSQGSALAFRLAASDNLKTAGAIACGGDLPPDVAERLADLEPFPVLLVHGKDDQSMSFAKAQEGEHMLRDHDFPVETLYFEGGHDIPPDILERVLQWMLEQSSTHAEETQP